ncbi:MAG: hypothetical protein BWY75_03367 [bacterium ADurb.Bin425]|nr:MAG: hypothetical protein BWY75_03367 [bacterium ADurb.Bin425]
MSAFQDQFLQFLKVIDLAVENYPNAFIFVGNWLLSSGYIDNREAGHTDGARSKHGIAFFIGTAVIDAFTHPSQMIVFFFDMMLI